MSNNPSLSLKAPVQDETLPARSEWEMSNDMNTPAKRQGMAITSLVLGALSVMCFGLFAGLPAIILGHVAHRRARKAPEQYSGSGLAIAGFVMGYVSIITTLFLAAVLAGMMLPALAKAKAKAQSITCINNMKQIGLAFRIWATDHQDRFPFNSPSDTNAPSKLVEAGMDAVQVFQSLSNELVTPKILVCPGDPAKRPALQFTDLSLSSISYEVETGPEVKASNPEEILARCPVHGHELRCDGSVHQNH